MDPDRTSNSGQVGLKSWEGWALQVPPRTRWPGRQQWGHPHPPHVPRCTSPAPLIAAWARQRPRRGPGADPKPTTAWETSPARPPGSPVPALRSPGPPCLPRTHLGRTPCPPVPTGTQPIAWHVLPTSCCLSSCSHILGAGLGLDRWGHLVKPMWGGCQPALYCCSSSHMAQGGRWPGSWPGPWNGVEGWVPTGAKPVSRSPSPGSLHNLGVGAGHGGVTRPSQPRTATGDGENTSLRSSRMAKCIPCARSDVCKGPRPGLGGLNARAQGPSWLGAVPQVTSPQAAH